MSRGSRLGQIRRRTWVLAAIVVAALALIGSSLLGSGPLEWFSEFTVSPTVAYSGDINVTLSATVVGLSGPVAGVPVQFVAYTVPGGPPLLLDSAVSGPHGVATAHFIPRAALTLRLFAEFQVPGTSRTVTSLPAVLEVYAAPIA